MWGKREKEKMKYQWNKKNLSIYLSKENNNNREAGGERNEYVPISIKMS